MCCRLRAKSSLAVCLAHMCCMAARLMPPLNVGNGSGWHLLATRQGASYPRGWLVPGDPENLGKRQYQT